MTTAAAPRHPLRENLETAAIAIVMALILKYFTLEAFQIPTGSMQPTLMGLDTGRGPAGGGLRVFDRILVDKLVPFFRDPERWEVWVFLYPLDRSNRYIKRVVGLPGEELKVAYGDLFVRRSPQEEWKILRKPPHVQEGVWRESWNSESTTRPGDYWDLTGFEERKEGLFATGEASAATRAVLTDSYLDGYPPALQKAIRESGRYRDDRNTVRDVRVRLRVRPGAEQRRLSILLDWSGDQVRADFSGPSGDGKVRLLVNDRAVGEFDGRLRLDRDNAVEFFRADEAIVASLDGTVLGRAEFTSHSRPEQAHANFRPPNRVKFETEGGTLAVTSIRLDRDLYYTDSIGGEPFPGVTIPEGCYFMMGDNSVDSADGRAWKQVTIELKTPIDGKTRLMGGNTTSGSSSGPNPRFTRSSGSPQWIFRDEFGEEYRYEQGATTGVTAHSCVPRDNFLGRAFFVFWPFPPFAPTIRIGPVE